MFLQFLCNNLDPVHRIQTKFGMDILLDPRNKPAKEFFIFLKIQDGRRRSKICDALYFFNVLAITWIWFYGSRQNLAWTYYLTLGTSLWKNFSFFLKSKMAAGGQIEFRHNFGSKFTFRLGKWIPFIRFGQNLAGRYYSTLGTSLRSNF